MLFVAACQLPASAQVYNYLPFHHFALETNPSILSYERDAPYLRFGQQGVPFSDGFSFSQLTASVYSKKTFLGAGTVLANARYNDSISYQHIGLGAGYRNIMFNKVYMKAGFMYKLLNVNSPGGGFDYYRFHASDSLITNSNQQNINYSVSLSSPSDFYYISFAMLNQALPWDNDNESAFPSYMVINVGNAANFSRSMQGRHQILATVYRKEVPYALTQPSSEWSYYLAYYRPIMNLTRQSYLQLGSRFGYTDGDWIHVTPTLRYTLRNRYSDHSLQIGTGLDLGYDKKTLDRQFDPQLQFQVIAEF